MTPAQELLKTLVQSAEGTRKSGYTSGGVSYQLNQQQDVITATVTVPIEIAVDSDTGSMSINAKDFLELGS